MDSLKRTKYCCRAAVVLLAALQLSCSKYETVEAEIIGFEEKSTIGVPSLVGLKLSPPTSKGRELAIKFELCPSLPIDREPACTEPQIQLGEANSPGLYDHVVSVVTDQKTLSARDLRIGQRIRTEYTPYHKLELPPVTVVEYAPPSKYLRLSLSVSLRKGLSIAEVESLLIAHLSWRLPQDVGIVRDTEPAENLDVIGEIEVKYFLVESKTAWQFRDTKTDEFLFVKTRLNDPQAHTNWTELKLSGGSEPLGNDAMSYSYESALMKLPMFAIER